MLTYAAQYICSHCKLCLLSWQSVFPSMWLWSSSELSSNPAFYNVIKITLCFFNCLFLLGNCRELWNCVIVLLNKIVPLSLPLSLSLSQLFILSLRREWLNKEKNLILSFFLSLIPLSLSLYLTQGFSQWLCDCAAVSFDLSCYYVWRSFCMKVVTCQSHVHALPPPVILV